MKEEVLAALRDYAAGKTGAPPPVAGAVASHFLAVATPNSIARISLAVILLGLALAGLLWLWSLVIA